MKGSNYVSLGIFGLRKNSKRLLRNKIRAGGGTASIFYKNVEEPNAKAIRFFSDHVIRPSSLFHHKA
ncbi:hypothetical protein H5410_054133 [Solanum commersonii]|uniref:Uncharacterized protein n=1 Tax=Solanum commersonii TaxID=4109 RepID=A0A9J5X6K6_SOLCO|nr:hypothetical protein H5410_054133 [Solanum commersonii]